MLLWNQWKRNLAAVLLGLTLGGCSLSSDNQQDDEKEPHFLVGKSRVNALDYSGAAEAFKEALEISPHSAPAHYQLAWLYENELTNAAAAIYHYQEYLDLSPKAGNRDVINQHIYACKQKLVSDVMQYPSAPSAQQQIEKLAAKNAAIQDELDKWHAYYAAELAARGNPAATSVPQPQANPLAAGQSVAPNQSNGANAQPPVGTHPQPPPELRMRTHTVAAGETLAAIARKEHVSVTALEAANPGLNPRRLHTGQTVNLPYK